MWLLLFVGLAVGGAFLADETTHPQNYPEASQANGIEIKSPPPPDVPR